MSADGSSADLEHISDQNWLEQSATVLATQKDTPQHGAESTLTDAWRAFVRNEAATPPHAASPTNWGKAHRHVFSPTHPDASGSHAPESLMHGMHGTPNLSPHRNQHNSHPVINLTPLPAPLPVSTTPNDALVSSSASVGAANTSPSHVSANMPSLSPSAAKSPTAQKMHGTQNPHYPQPSLLNSITNTSGDFDGMDSNLPYLEFVPSSHNSAGTAHTHAPMSPTASGSHALNLMRTPSGANTPVATPGHSPGSSPLHSSVHNAAHSTAPAMGATGGGISPFSAAAAAVPPKAQGGGAYTPGGTGSVPGIGPSRGNPMAATENTDADELTEDFLQNTLPTEFQDEGGYGAPVGSDVLLSEIWGTKTNDISDFRIATDSAVSGTPAASLSLAIPSNSPVKPGNLSSSMVGAAGGDRGGFSSDGNGSPSKPGLPNVPGVLHSPGSLHAVSVHGGHASTAASPAQPFTPSTGGAGTQGGRGSLSGASSDPPSPNPMVAPNSWQPLASVGGLTSAGGITPDESPELSRRSSVDTGGNMLAELRAESVVSPEGSLNHEAPILSKDSRKGSGGPTNAALMTGMHDAIHPSSRDAADSAALSLALGDMEKQFEDDHILSARGHRGQRLMHETQPLQEPPSTQPTGVNPVPASGYNAPSMHVAHASVHSSTLVPSVHSATDTRAGVDAMGGRPGGVQGGNGGAVLRTASQRSTHGSGHHAIDSTHMASAGSGMPPRPSPPNSRPTSVAGGSSGYPGSHPGSQAGSHPGSHYDSHHGSHRSSTDLDGPADETFEEHFLEDSLGMLYPEPGMSIDAFLRDHSDGLPNRPSALHSVPVHVVNATQGAIRGGSADSNGLPHVAAAGAAGRARKPRPASAGTAARGSRTSRYSGGTSGGYSGHRRTVSQGPGRGSGMRHGNLTSRPSLSGGHSRSKSGSVGVISQRPAWGTRRDDTATAAKRASLQSIHSTYSISAHNKSASLRSGGSVHASLHSTHSTRSKSALHSGGSASVGATGTCSDWGRQGSFGGFSALPKTPHRAPHSARTSTVASVAAQRARAGAKLAASHAGRGPSFGTPPGRGGRTGGRGRRPATARPATSSSPSPLKGTSSLSASHGGGGSRGASSSGAAGQSKLPNRSGLTGLGQKLQTGTSAASIRSTASGSSRIAAVPAHGMSAAGAPAAARAGAQPARSAAAAAAGAVSGSGLHSNSSSAVPLRHQSVRTNGTTSLQNSDAIFASVDHSNAADNLSDVFSSELPNSPTGLSDSHFASTNANPFLPMFPAALGANGLLTANADSEVPGEKNTFTPPVGQIFQNIPDQSESTKLSDSASQFVRGKLAAGIVSPEPKAGAARMHAPMHDEAAGAVVPTMNMRHDVEDISQRLANPQPSPMLAASIMKTSLHTTSESNPSRSHAPSPALSRQPSSHPVSTNDVKSVKSSTKPSRSPSPQRHLQQQQQQQQKQGGHNNGSAFAAGGGNTSISHSDMHGRHRQSVSKALSSAPSSPAHSQMSAAGSTSARSGRVTMSRRAMIARKEALSQGLSPRGSDFAHSENLAGVSGGTSGGDISALGASPEQSMTPTVSGADSMTPSSQRPLLPHHSPPQKSKLGPNTENTSGDDTVDDAHAMDVVVSVAGPGGASVPSSAPNEPPSADQTTPPAPPAQAGTPNALHSGQNDQEGAEGGALKDGLTPPHSTQTTPTPSLLESGAKMVTLGDALSSIGHSEIAAVVGDVSPGTGSKVSPERARGGKGETSTSQPVSRKKNPFGALLCCFVPSKTAAE